MSDYEKRLKFEQIRKLIIEIDSDERANDFYERGLETHEARAKTEATVIARCDLGNALGFIRIAERRIGIRDGNIKP